MHKPIYLLLAGLALQPVTTLTASELDCPTASKVRYFDVNTVSFIDNAFCQGKDFADGLAAVYNGKHWGYIDKSGELVIDFQYNDAGDFSHGYAAVNKDGNWGIIDKTNQISGDFHYQSLQAIAIDGTALFIASKTDALGLTKYGILTAAAETRIAFDYLTIDYADKSHQFYAKLVDDKAYEKAVNAFFGSLESNLTKLEKHAEIEVYNKNLESIYRFAKADDVFFNIANHLNWVDDAGNFTSDFTTRKPLVSPPNYVEQVDIQRALNDKVFSENGKVGVKTEQGVIIPAQFDKILANVGQAIATEQTTVDYLATYYNGKTTDNPLLPELYLVNFYLVVKNGKQGVYGIDGTPIIKASYDSIKDQENGFVVSTTLNGQTAMGLLDFFGKEIIPPSPDYAYLKNSANGNIIVGKTLITNANYRTQSEAVFSKDGKLLVPFDKYNSISPDNPFAFSSELTTVNKYQGETLKYGVIDALGNEIIAPENAYISYWLDENIIVLSKSFNPPLYQLYYSASGQISAQFSTDNWQSKINPPTEGVPSAGLLKVELLEN